jgi:hypothetical protein
MALLVRSADALDALCKQVLSQHDDLTLAGSTMCWRRSRKAER